MSAHPRQEFMHEQLSSHAGSMGFAAPSVDLDGQAKAHRRKMQRRQANRKSAQLSRARKKEFLDCLQAENMRLQRLVDALESQPEVTFCVTIDGIVSFISERTRSLVYGCESLDISGGDIPLSAILVKECAADLIRAIGEAEGKYMDVQKQFNTGSVNMDSNLHNDNMAVLSSVGTAEQYRILPPVINLDRVRYHDATGYILEGQIRASRIMAYGGDRQRNNGRVGFVDASESDGGASMKARSGAGINRNATESSRGLTSSSSLSTKGANGISHSGNGRKRTRSAVFDRSTAAGEYSADDSASATPSSTIAEGANSGVCTTDKVEYVCVIRPSEIKTMRNPLDLFSSAISRVRMTENDRHTAENFGDHKNKNSNSNGSLSNTSSEADSSAGDADYDHDGSKGNDSEEGNGYSVSTLDSTEPMYSLPS